MTEVHPSAVGRKFIKPRCPRGHFKRLTGVDTQNTCLLCRQEHTRRQSKKRRLKKRNRQGYHGERVEIPNLRVVRKRHGLSMREFAVLSGVDKTRICRYENKQAKAGYETAKKIIAAVVKLENRKKRLWM